ncbi:MAG: hypothetical protein DRO87_12605 [Candidatus Thorarchaeota archaeon]|nr:MAG: hypothetical protein DRO87_12605 [Candidatus Thorarchaeota archaeon]
MRILVVPAVDWFTALENRVHHLVRFWLNDNEVHVVHIPLGGKPLRSAGGERIHRLSTARTTSLLLYYVMNFFPQLVQITRIIRREKIDIVVTTNLSAGTAAIISAKLLGVKSIFDYCDYLPAFSRYAGVWSFLQRLLRATGELLTVFNLRASQGVVVIGKRLLYHASRFNPIVLEVPNGVDPSRFEKAGRWRPSPNPVLGYVGILEFFVDLESAMRALRLLEGCRLVIVGDGRERPRLESVTRLVGVEQRVEMAGRVPYDQVQRWISSMDICLLPFERSELTESALPLKIHEYAASCRPIISSSLFEVRRMYGDLLLYAEGADQIVAAVNHIVENPKETLKRIRRSFIRSTRTYSWSALAPMYQRAFQRVLSQGREEAQQ